MIRAMLRVVLCMMLCNAAVAGTDTKPAEKKVSAAKPARRPSEKNDLIRVRMATTMGDIVLQLDAKKAPIAVENFLRYVDERFYDRTVIHRVIPHFLIQGGGYTTASLLPKSKGLHGPIKNEWNNRLKNTRMTIGAARVPGKPDSATSQFYINVADNPRLDQAQEDGAGYAVFGRVIGSESTVERIRNAELRVHSRYQEPSGRAVTPEKLIVIQSIRRIDAKGKVIEPQSEPPAEPDVRDEVGAGDDEVHKKRGGDPNDKRGVEPVGEDAEAQGDVADEEAVDEDSDAQDTEPVLDMLERIVEDNAKTEEDADAEDDTEDNADAEDDTEDTEDNADTEDDAENSADTEDNADAGNDAGDEDNTEGETDTGGEDDAPPSEQPDENDEN